MYLSLPSMPSSTHGLHDGHSGCLGLNLFSPWCYLHLLLLYSIISTEFPNLSVEYLNSCDRFIILPALLTFDDGAEAGLFKCPWVVSVWQGLTEIVMPTCSSWGPSWSLLSLVLCLVCSVFACFLLVFVHTKWWTQNLLRQILLHQFQAE